MHNDQERWDPAPFEIEMGEMGEKGWGERV